MTQGNILFYSGANGDARLEVLFENDSFWLTQKHMAELFEVTIPTINYHLKEIFQSGELVEERTIRKLLTVQKEGSREVSRAIEYYDLDAIIAVGYRVNSRSATKFRIWATSVLKEYLIKGFVLDDERLKQGKAFGKDYFDELLERIREIRASERRFWQKITDIFEQCSIDYDKDSADRDLFFKKVQNKLHWAVTGKTAAEIIAQSADAEKPNMGLQTWKNAPKGRIRKSDTGVAKNYLDEESIKQLERLVTMYLDFAENQARRQIQMTMKEWAQKLDAFLDFNGYEVLTHAGKISHQIAIDLADAEFAKFKIVQDRIYENDFEKMVKLVKREKSNKD